MEAGTDWGVLSQELEKILLFTSKARQITGEDALAVLGYRKAADPFALSRLVQERKLKESLSHMRRLFDGAKGDDPAFRTLAQISMAISRQVKAKRMLKAGLPAASILGKLRLHPYWDRDYLDQLEKFSQRRLIARSQTLPYNRGGSQVKSVARPEDRTRAPDR